MEERKTHYQLSFTARQALGLFAAFLAALAGAYFLGLMSGLAGRQTAAPPAGQAVQAVAAAPVPTEPAREGQSTPPPFATPALARKSAPAEGAARSQPLPERTIQLFEDEAATEPTPTSAPAPRAAAPAAPATATGFWVQVISTSSEREAKARAAALSTRGYPAAVSTAPGQKFTLYRVRVGPFGSREEALKASDRLTREEKLRTWIVPPGQ